MLHILYKNTKSCRGTHSRKRRGRNCCCKGKTFIWIVQGIWGKNVQGECKKSKFTCFYCRAAAIFMQKVWKWRWFLTVVGCWKQGEGTGTEGVPKSDKIHAHTIMMHSVQVLYCNWDCHWDCLRILGCQHLLKKINKCNSVIKGREFVLSLLFCYRKN